MGCSGENSIFNEDSSGDSETGHLEMTMLFPEEQPRQRSSVRKAGQHEAEAHL